MTFALIAFAAMLGLILLRIPIAFAMLIVGFTGFGLLVGWSQAVSMIGQVAYDTGLNYEFSVLPLFILMGNFTTKAGDSDYLYEASNAFLGHLRGGLAMATVVACGGFSAISGSSLATAATFAKVSMPPMRRYGYSDRLAAASIAAGGTLGILIPPSVIMVIYGIITETNIGKLFIAGIIPGIIGILGYTTAIQVIVRIRPELGPPAKYTPWPERIAALKKVWGILALFILVMGGIYGGIFTSTEAAGIGAGGAFLLVLLRGKLTWKSLFEVLIESARSTAMLFFILIGALVVSNLVNVAGLPAEMTAWVKSLDVAPIVVLFVIVGLYLLLGSFLESVSMVLLTVPIFFPIVTALGYDPVWFGVIVVVITEIGLIHPPLGLNVFVLTSLLPEIPASEIFKGLIPFLLADLIRLLIMIFFPIITLILPNMM